MEASLRIRSFMRIRSALDGLPLGSGSDTSAPDTVICTDEMPSHSSDTSSRIELPADVAGFSCCTEERRETNRILGVNRSHPRTALILITWQISKRKKKTRSRPVCPTPLYSTRSYS